MPVCCLAARWATYGPYIHPLDGPFRQAKNGPSQMRRPGLSTKNPDKSPLIQILSHLFARVFVRGFVRWSFHVWKVLSEVVFVCPRSVRIYPLHQKVKHH